jgi:uncharacterized C2H2 Zn-finger protein
MTMILDLERLAILHDGAVAALRVRQIEIWKHLRKQCPLPELPSPQDVHSVNQSPLPKRPSRSTTPRIPHTLLDLERSISMRSSQNQGIKAMLSVAAEVLNARMKNAKASYLEENKILNGIMLYVWLHFCSACHKRLIFSVDYIIDEPCPACGVLFTQAEKLRSHKNKSQRGWALTGAPKEKAQGFKSRGQYSTCQSPTYIHFRDQPAVIRGAQRAGYEYGQ